MATSHPLHNHPDAKILRAEAGKYVRALREAAGKTQQQVSRDVGIEYYTMISQVEGGKTRVPPDKMLKWAQSVGADPQAFARRLLKCYDPYMWQMLFGTQK